MNIEQKILEIYDEIKRSKKSLSKLQEVEATSDKLFGGAEVRIPAAGAHGGQKGWQSANAWDIMTKVGSPVYAIADGKVRTFNDYGPTPIHTDGKTLFGAGFTVDSKGGLPAVYYTHLKDVKVKQGDDISCGQLIGYVMDFPGSEADHVHIGVESGDIKQFMNSDGSLRCSKGSSQLGGSSTDLTKTTSSKSSEPQRDEIVYKIAKKIGDLFLPKESIEEQKSFGRGVQNRYGRIVIPKESNPKIVTPISGEVYNKKFFESCKNQILIRNQDNEKIYVLFCGITTPLVRDGQSVTEGQVIGKTDSDVDVTMYDASWNKIYIKDDFEVKKKKIEPSDKDKKKPTKDVYYSDPAVALMASLPGMAFDKIFGNRYDEKTGELKQKRWGGVADKKPVDPWVLDFIKKPFTKKVNEDIERIKKLL